MSLTDRHLHHYPAKASSNRPLTPELERRLTGRTVKVHRNLQNGLWSITFANKVVAHAPTVHLANVTFPVSQAGRQRVLRERQKNVHAYAQGTYCRQGGAACVPISYDPYASGYFFTTADKKPVYLAEQVSLSEGKAYAFNINDY